MLAAGFPRELLGTAGTHAQTQVPSGAALRQGEVSCPTLAPPLSGGQQEAGRTVLSVFSLTVVL